MKKLLPIIMTGAMLCACGKTEGTGTEPTTTPEATGTQTQQSATEPQVLPEEPVEPLWYELPAEYVAGNGSYFVRLSDGVYFHSYEKEAFEDLALYGDLLDYCQKPEDATTLYRYDEESGETMPVAADGCTGKLYWFGDCFFSDGYDEFGGEVNMIARNGEETRYCPGWIAGISEDGESLAIWVLAGDEVQLKVLDPELNERYTMLPSMINHYNYCGIIGNNVIYRTAGEEGEVFLHSYDGSKETTLGMLTKSGDFANPRCEQLTELNGRVYCVLGWHSGVYDDYKEFEAVSFLPGQADSLTVEMEGYDVNALTEAVAYRPPYYQSTNGSVSCNGQAPDRVYLSDGDYGDLMIDRTAEQTDVLAENFIDYPDRESLKLLTSQMLGEDLYLMIAGVSYVPEEDYEWLRFYRYEDRMYYLKLSPGGEIESFFGADWAEASTFDAESYAEFLGSWQIAEIPAPEGEEGERQESTRTTRIEFLDTQRAEVTQDNYVGGSYELECGIVDGKLCVSGFCKLYGHHFTAWFEDGELNVEFVQRMGSTWGDETKTWLGYYVTAPVEEESAE